MEINITLFIQLINFLLTYYILNKFIFAPVIKALNKKKIEENQLLTSLNKEKQLLIANKKEEIAQITNFQKKVATLYQKPTQPTININFDIAYKRDSVEVKKTIKQIKSFLIKKVPHVD